MTPRERKYHEQGLRDGRSNREGAAGAARHLRESLVKLLGVPEAEAMRRVVKDYAERLDAQPPLTKYPELKGVRECIVAYNEGVALGSGVTIEDVILRDSFIYTVTRKLRTPVAATGPGCTLVYFPRSDRGPLVANNNDGDAASAHRNPPWWVVSNRAGLILGTVSSGIFCDEESPEIFPAPVLMMVNELCGTASETVDLMTRLNHFWGPFNFMVADRKGGSAVIEKSSCRLGVRKSADGFSAMTEMSAEEPVFKKYLWETREKSLRERGLTKDSADWAYWKAAEVRSARLLRLVDEAKGEPTYEKLERIIYDHIGSPEQVHMDGSKCHPDQEEGEWTLRTAVWEVDARRARYSFAEPPVSSHLTRREVMTFEKEETVF